MYRHYISTDNSHRIIDGWSDGPRQDRGATDAILLTDQGGYQFRLEPEGEENPDLTNPDGTHCYIYDPTLSPAYREATAEELAAERAEIEAAREQAEPSSEEVIGAQVAQLALKDIQKGQVINALGAQLAQISLEIINLRGSAL